MQKSPQGVTSQRFIPTIEDTTTAVEDPPRGTWPPATANGKGRLGWRTRPFHASATDLRKRGGCGRWLGRQLSILAQSDREKAVQGFASSLVARHEANFHKPAIVGQAPQAFVSNSSASPKGYATPLQISARSVRRQCFRWRNTISEPCLLQANRRRPAKRSL